MNKILIIIVLVFIYGCKQKSVSQIKSNKKEAIVRQFSKTHGDVGILVLWGKDIYSAGYSDLERKIKIDKDALFEIGSASKIFTAIAIIKLIEEGKLALDTKLNTLYNDENMRKLSNFEGKNYWDRVTIEMLLNHTSGFVDYMDTLDSEEKTLEIFGNSDKNYSFNEIIKMATDFGNANFIPESKFQYTNTGYIILGDIISKVSNMTWREYIEKNIFKKANLKNTFFGSKMTQEIKSKVINGYYKNKITHMPYSLAGSAGEIVSNIEDLGKFLTYWEEGKFFKKPQTFNKQISTGLNNMYPDDDNTKYGLGIMLLDQTVGHGGQTFGFQSYIAIEPRTKKVCVIGINNANVSSTDLFLKLKQKGK